MVMVMVMVVIILIIMVINIIMIESRIDLIIWVVTDIHLRTIKENNIHNLNPAEIETEDQIHFKIFAE